MTFRRTIAFLAVAAALPAAAAAQSRFSTTQAALDSNTLPSGGLNAGQSGFSAPAPEFVPGALAPAPALDPVQGSVKPQIAPLRSGGREPHGNPLWAIPLSSLTATRERPIFVPSRRPPAPVVAGPPPVQRVRPPPPPPPPPERPKLALVGAVVGESEGIAVFVDQNTRDVLRLRTGENHQGWTLRSVKGREATLEKDRETMLLALPAPNETSAPMAPDPSGRFRGIASGATPPVPAVPMVPGIPPLPGGDGGPRLKGPGIVPPSPGVPAQVVQPPPPQEPQL